MKKTNYTEEELDTSMYEGINTPAYVFHKDVLLKNIEIVKKITDNTNAKILLALKASAYVPTFDILSTALSGTCASGLYEAKLGKEHFKGEVHTFSPAFVDEEFDEIVELSDHIVFNSLSQIIKYKDRAKNKHLSVRINPESNAYAPIDLYNPSRKHSRFGCTINEFIQDEVNGHTLESLIDENVITGLHFHSLCEQGLDSLKDVLESVEYKFGKYLNHPNITSLNMGGGHLLVHPMYDIDGLIELIHYIQNKYNVSVIMEPGEGTLLNGSCQLVSKVIDIKHNEIDIAICDTSTNHMPDIIEFNGAYQPYVTGSSAPFEKEHTYQLAGNTCLSGDIMATISFENELKPGDLVVFEDQAYYTFVKNTDFNGIKRPSLIYMDVDGSILHQRDFGYEDFKRSLE